MRLLFAVLLMGALTGHACAGETPKNSCDQPVVPNAHASDLLVNTFNSRAAKYKKCITQFVEEQQKISKQTLDTAKSNEANEAAEEAIKEYNAFMVRLNARNPIDD
jgi:hypothetical protein